MFAPRSSLWPVLLGAAFFACNGSIDEPGALDPELEVPGVPDDNDGDGIPDISVPAPPGLRRLTAPQFVNSLRDLTGIDLGRPTLEPDLPSNGFVTVGASRSTISPRGVEQYETCLLYTSPSPRD